MAHYVLIREHDKLYAFYVAEKISGLHQTGPTFFGKIDLSDISCNYRLG